MFLKIKKRSGFTLIEVLIATVLFLSILICAGSGLFQGIRLYEKLISVSQDEKLAFFFERLTKDLKNSTDYSECAFSTNGTSVSFATLKNSGEVGENYFEARPVKVTYRFDSKLGEIHRNEKNLIENTLERKEILISNLEAFNLSVLGDEKAVFPQSIFVQVVFSSKKYQKRISIPLHHAPSP